MERLTSRDEKGNLNVDGKEVYAGYLYNAVALLEEYEDTGLIPEQIMELKEAEDFLSDFFKEMEDKPDLTDRQTLNKIIMRSCKSAVKGGDPLTQTEIQALVKDLDRCVNPFSCPHGRPTFIRMTKYEIEKLFKRV